MIELTQEQINAKEEILAIIKDHPFATLGGYAGTGKTTLIKSLLTENTAVMAFTGKAAHVLRSKQVPAQTIHKTLYTLIVDEENKPILDLDGNLQWILNHDLKADLIIVDEASMVPKWIFDDIGKLGIPTIFVGDHGQLPPVGDTFNLMENPDVKLEKIHRNAGEIAKFARFVREGNNPRRFKGTPDNLGSVRFSSFDAKDMDQVICGFNNTRHQVNRSVAKSSRFEEGDKIIILENKTKFRVFNGMQGVVTEVKRAKLTFDCNGESFSIPFNPSSPEKMSPHGVKVGYAYCITCHKAQGDEWDTVGVIEEHCDYWEEHRWNYTAASRAKQTLYWS